MINRSTVSETKVTKYSLSYSCINAKNFTVFCFFFVLEKVKQYKVEFPDGTSEQWKSYEIDPDMVITVVASGYVLFMNILLVNLVIAMFR